MIFIFMETKLNSKTSRRDYAFLVFCNGTNPFSLVIISTASRKNLSKIYSLGYYLRKLC